MKTSIILAIALFMGISSVTYASNDKETHLMVSAATAFEYCTNLLEKSEVANKLKSSSIPSVRARYATAVKIYNQAISAYESGNEEIAQELINDSIRTVAVSIPLLYSGNRIAMADL